MSSRAALASSATRLAVAEARLEAARSVMGAGAWEIDTATCTLRCHGDFYERFGIGGAEAGIPMSRWFEAVHPADRPRLRATYDEAARRGGEWRAEYRAVTPGGEVRHLCARGAAAPDPDGAVRRAVGVTVDVTERVRAADELRAARDEAERASAAKTRFLAAASHDLRQPIQGLFLLVGTLRDRLAGGPHEALARTTQEALEALRSLLDGLLDVSRLEAGLVVPRNGLVDLGATVARLAAEYAPAASARGVSLRAVAPPATLRTDGALLERILRNLIENALRYTGPGGRVLLGARRSGRVAVLQVIDTGIGIPAAELGNIWHEFHQAENAERDRGKGLGLGLAIVRRLASLLGFQLGVSSEPGSGSRFWVEVPVVAWRRGGPGGGGAQPLVAVDPDPHVRAGLRAMLAEWGVPVVGAPDAEAAVHSLAESGDVPAAILADHGAAQDGFAAVACLRAAFGDRPIPALLAIGDPDPETLEAAACGGLAVVGKPVTASELRAALGRLPVASLRTAERAGAAP